jgi:hypothetical protein
LIPDYPKTGANTLMPMFGGQVFGRNLPLNPSGCLTVAIGNAQSFSIVNRPQWPKMLQT